MSVYLDYNASAPVDGRVIDYMVEVYRNNIGNADSRTHNYGENARNIVEEARKKVASLIGVTADEVFFTSGATESNNIAIQGLREYAIETGRKHIVTTAIEHKAVLETVRALEKEGFVVDIVKPDLSGRVNADDILSKIKKETLLVSIMHVNNETATKKYAGVEVINCKANEIEWVDYFDGIWASASLLHVPYAEMKATLYTVMRALKPNGIMYFSVKKGQTQRLDEGRLYTDYSENSITELLTGLDIVQIEHIWESNDVRNQDKKWINVLVKRKKNDK